MEYLEISRGFLHPVLCHLYIIISVLFKQTNITAKDEEFKRLQIIFVVYHTC